MKYFRISLILILFVLISGCASMSNDIQKGAYYQPDNSPIKSGYARVYFYRNNDTLDYANDIYANGKKIGVISPDVYFVKELPVGNYQFKVTTDGCPVLRNHIKFNMDVNSQKTYYIEFATISHINQVAPVTNLLVDGTCPNLDWYHFGPVSRSKAEKGMALSQKNNA